MKNSKTKFKLNFLKVNCLFILSIISLIFNVNAFAQMPYGADCEFDASSNQQSGQSNCAHTSTLYSQSSRFLPLTEYGNIKIRINIILLYKNDGTGNYNMNVPEEAEIVNGGFG
ncbi:MAG: hypothetical protein V9E90_14050 [Saprospiraceae bacterium]|jgi:hypothetical protein